MSTQGAPDRVDGRIRGGRDNGGVNRPANPDVATPRRHLGRAAGIALFLAIATPAVWRFLVAYPPEIWQVDLEVYRAGSRAVLDGFPLYLMRTSSPQFLPFTYPPFAALAGLPLALVPFAVAGWCWTALQLALLWYVVGRSFAPFLRRSGSWAAPVQGLIAGTCVWFLPVQDSLRYGQVNAVIVALCLADLTRRASPSVPRGALVGLAVAVKLTPGVFWLHWAFSRRWRTLATSVATFLLVTAAAFVVVPGASVDFWTDALLDSDRLGPNDGTANQSLRGALMRVGPAGAAGNLVWVVLAGAALAAGLLLARRLDRLGDHVAVVAVVGLVALLVSPVSWIHHAMWGVVVVGVLLGDGRRRARRIAAVAACVLQIVRLPWWGGDWLLHDSAPHALARLAQNSYPLLAVAALVAIAVFSREAEVRSGDERSAEQTPARP